MLDKYYIYRSNIYHIDSKIIVKYCIELYKKRILDTKVKIQFINGNRSIWYSDRTNIVF